MTDLKNNHGGAREGAGRKPKGQESCIMRVPTLYKDAIKAMIKHLDATEEIDLKRNPVPKESEKCFIRSNAGRAQHITIKTYPMTRYDD